MSDPRLRAPGESETSRRSFLATASRSAGAAVFAGSAASLEAAPRPSKPGNEVIYKSATTLANMIRTKEAKSVEVVKAFLDRIDAVNGRLNAAVFIARKEALDRARTADAALSAGESWGPLHGLPITIKDCFEVAGMPTTNGAPGLKDYVSKTAATVVRRLEEAGAIVLAKTNVPFMCSWFESSNLAHGKTNNPYGLDRTPGGSSGGEAAILAAGGSPLGVGTDSGGSIRVPSHWCGLAGIYPSWGRVSMAGRYPPWPENKGPHFGSPGPMARYVEDLALALPLLAGPDYRDAFTFDLPLRSPRDVHLDKLRVAFFTQFVNEYGDEVVPTAETSDAIQKAASALEACGANVKQKRPSKAELADRVGVAMDVTPEFPDSLHAQMKQYGAEADPLMQSILRWAEQWLAKTPPKDRQRFRSALPEVRTNLLQFMEQHEVLLMPVSSRPAPKHGTTTDSQNLDGLGYTGYINLVGSLPAGTVRCGTSPEGLPVGVMVVGARWREDIVLAVLEMLEKEFGGWSPPPEENLG